MLLLLRSHGGGSASASLEITFGADSAGNVRVYGVSDLAVTVSIDSAGNVKAYGASSLEITLDIVSSYLRTFVLTSLEEDTLELTQLPESGSLTLTALEEYSG